MARKRRFPDYLILNVNSQIRAAAYKLRAENLKEKKDPGFSNADIVERITDEVHKLFASHYRALTQHYLSTQVPLVLEGKTAERRVSTPIQLGLGLEHAIELAEWLAVPSVEDEDNKKGDAWKIPRDCSPNELERIENRRDSRIKKEQAENEKIRIIRTTALERGCGPDDPISTVFPGENDRRPPQPDDRPRL